MFANPLYQYKEQHMLFPIQYSMQTILVIILSNNARRASCKNVLSTRSLGVT